MAAIEVEVDERGRASLKSAGIAPGRYRVERSGGAVMLEPVTSYTRAELLAMADPELRQKFQDARDGKIEFTSPDDLP